MCNLYAHLCLLVTFLLSDSKTLTEDKREKLFEVIKASDYIAWMVVSLSAAELSNKMCQRYTIFCVRIERLLYWDYRGAVLSFEMYRVTWFVRLVAEFSACKILRLPATALAGSLLENAMQACFFH